MAACGGAAALAIALLVALPPPAAAGPNIPTPTFPDSSLWRPREPIGDAGWSLQQNRVTQHWRLLDQGSIRRAWGTRAECEAAYRRMVTDASGAEATVGLEPEPNLPFPTMGGTQFWMDVRVRHGWRLQRNVLTGHARLLSPWDMRVAWGTREAMLLEWERVVVPRLAEIEARDGPPEKIVIFLHGIVRSKDTWILNVRDVEARARATGRAIEAWGVAYPSTRLPIEESADGLGEIIWALPPEIPIVIVCHSMGGMVTNAYLGRRGRPASSWPHRIESIVYLGTPFGGSPIADSLRDTAAYGSVYGPSGQQLVTSPVFLEQFPWPDCRTVCIAGSNPPDGYNESIPGDDDGTVALVSAHPAEATERHTVAAMHSFIMFTDAARAKILEVVFGGAVAP